MSSTFKFFNKISRLTSLEYKAVHRTKIFGILWKFLNPLLFIAVYTFVFSTLYTGGSRGFIISMGILLFSGISTSINSSTSWIQPKILNYSYSVKKINLIFMSKIYFNFIPIFYLIPVMVLIQRLLFNIDFKFTIFESLEIFLQTILLTFFTMIYCFILCIPISILSKHLTDVKDLVSHLLRIILYLSPILWIAKTDIDLINYLLQLFNPFYFIFESLNFIIYRSYDVALLSFVTPSILVIFTYLAFIRNKKYVTDIKMLAYR